MDCWTRCSDHHGQNVRDSELVLPLTVSRKSKANRLLITTSTKLNFPVLKFWVRHSLNCFVWRPAIKQICWHYCEILIEKPFNFIWQMRSLNRQPSSMAITRIALSRHYDSGCGHLVLWTSACFEFHWWMLNCWRRAKKPRLASANFTDRSMT